MSSTHTTIRLPNPKYRALVVAVQESQFANVGGVLPVEGVLYGSIQWKTFLGGDYLKKFDGFRYVGQGGDARDGGTLIFAPPIPQSEKNQPYRTITRCVKHYWYPILKALEIIPDYNTPRLYKFANGTTVSGPSFYVREDYIPAATEGSRLVIEYFYSDTPFDIPQYVAPQPGSVSYDVPGVRGGFPECLHKDITIPDLTTASAIQIVGASSGSQSATVGSGISGQFFPKTNFTDRAPYVISDEQDFENGYTRVRQTVYPPPPGSLTIQ